MRGACDNGPGNAGADTYFVGDFTVSDSLVTGSESRVLYANAKWQALSGADCAIRWTMSGTVGGASACGRCDLVVNVQATPDITGSNCPDTMMDADARPFSVGYAVERLDGGNVRVYFAKSGKLLGEGFHDGDRFNYVTAHKCSWF